MSFRRFKYSEASFCDFGQFETRHYRQYHATLLVKKVILGLLMHAISASLRLLPCMPVELNIINLVRQCAHDIASESKGSNRSKIFCESYSEPLSW